MEESHFSTDALVSMKALDYTRESCLAPLTILFILASIRIVSGIYHDNDDGRMNDRNEKERNTKG